MASSEDERMEEDVDEEEEDNEISNPDVLTKYKNAAEIANRAVTHVIQNIAPGKKIIDICILGDKFIEDQLAGVFKSKQIEKGVAFPTCISVNNVVGHFSPLPGEESVLQEGDIVKIDLGVHIDGFITMGGHTVICTAQPGTAVTGRKADVILAAHYAAECAHRLIKPGKKNSDVTAAIAKVAEQYKVQPLEGVLSHQLKRYVVDGNQVIINKETLEHKVDEFEFQENEVYCVDILISSGEGKAKELEAKTTVYKRAVDTSYNLKMKTSREIFNEINKKFPTFPFTLRALDEKKGRLGVSEMLKHDLLVSYPVLFEKPNEVIAQIKFTVAITPNASDRLTGPFPLPNVASENKIDNKELLDVLALGTKRTKKNKSRNKKKKVKTETTTTTTTTETKPAPMDTN